VVCINDNEQAFQIQEASGVIFGLAFHYLLYNGRMKALWYKDHPKISQKKVYPATLAKMAR
jgi:hypothetical protein